MNTPDLDHLAYIFELREAGHSYSFIGDQIGTTRQRAHQLYVKAIKAMNVRRLAHKIPQRRSDRKAPR